MSYVRACKAVLALLFVTCAHACTSCDQQSFIAELVAQENKVERDFAKTQNQWNTAKAGERFKLGDGLRTGTAGQATLKLGQNGRLLVKGDTIVRFAQTHDVDDANEPKPEFDVLQGELTIESGERQLGVHTSRGLVTVSKETTVRIRAEQDTTHFDVDVGLVEYMHNGAKQVAQAGGSFDVDVLEVSVEAQAAQATPAKPLTAVAEDDSPEAKTNARPTENYVFKESPVRAFFSVAAGETATVHDPAPPSDVAVAFGGCDDEMVLEIDQPGGGRVRYRGRGEARAPLTRGNQRYRVRCLQDERLGPVVRSGQLRVSVDAATRPLPLTPVTITADADGRRYTVSYQNLQPIITLRWPYAPKATKYHLVVQSAQGQQLSEDSAQAVITLQPGRLGEGLHRFWFEAAGGKRSETGSLQVSFDYAARTAYLTSPRDGEALKDNATRLSGGTLLGSQVQVQGVALKTDAHGRFATTLAVPAEQSGAVVRVQHPSAGIHYYVRHLTH